MPYLQIITVYRHEDIHEQLFAAACSSPFFLIRKKEKQQVAEIAIFGVYMLAETNYG